MALLDSGGATVRAATNRIVNWRRSLLTLAQWDPAPARKLLPIKRIAAQATAMWLATRVIFVLLTVLARTFGFAPLAPTAPNVFPVNQPLAGFLLPLLAIHPELASWVHWDASWYLLISMHGYSIVTPDSSGFFPMYPLQIHLLTLLVGQQALVLAALLASNLASLVAFIGLGLLAAHEASREERVLDASAALIKVTAAYPFAFFLFAPFTEGFFLACVVFTLLCARRGWWRGAAIWALLSGLTRPTAVVLVPALAWEYGRQHGLWLPASWREGAWRSARTQRAVAGGLLVVAAMPLGLLSYLLYLKVRYGGFLMPIKAQALYHGHKTWPIWQTLIVLFQRFISPPSWTPPIVLLYLDGGLLILFLVLTLLNMRRLPVLYTLYMLGTFALLLASPVPHRPELIPSAGRYLLMSPPIFLLFSRWTRERPWLEMLVVGGGFMLQALFVVFFLNGTWIE
jgi:hypothetical protein